MLAVHDIVTAKSFDNIRASAFRVVGAIPFCTGGGFAVAGVVVVTIPNCFVNDVDVFEVGEFFSDGVKPFRNVLLGLFYCNAWILLFAKKVRVLGTPNQGVKFEVTFARLFFCPFIGTFAFIVIVPGEFTCAGVAV